MKVLGRIRKTLSELGLQDNTIVIFTSDNGGMAASNQYRGIDRSREFLDSRFSTSNLPLRGAKGWNYEGGIRVPLIVHWPGKIRPGTTSDAVVTGTDYYPTLLEMLGLPPMPNQHIDGKSFVSALNGRPQDRGAVYWHFPHYSNHGYQSPNGAIRDGKYKLIEYFENGTVQLFDLENDVGEQRDLSKDDTFTADRLRTMLHQWREKVDAKLPKTKATAAQPSSHSWNQPPSAELIDRTPGLIHKTLDSKFMPNKVGYNVVLPPSYQTDKQRRFPVVYWLHGGGGNECSDLWISRHWRQWFQQKDVQEVILVFPNGGRSSYWDHRDSKVMMESMIVKELIPHVDANFRTAASRESRALHGFSMGASGSLKFAIKYPELFCSVVAYGGGAIDLEQTEMPFLKAIIQRNLGGDPKLVRKNNTYRMLDENHQRINQLGVSFKLICGDADTWKSSAVDFQKELETHNIETDLTLVEKVGHNIGQLIEAQGKEAARFQERVFRLETQ